MHTNIASPWKFLPLALMLGLTISSSANAQPNADVQVTLDPNSRLGSYTYVPGQWGEIHLHLENRSETPKELLSTSYFGNHSTLQFGRKIWLPAHSKMALSYPAHFPPAEQSSDGRVTVQSMVFDQSQGQEVLLKGGNGQFQQQYSFSVPEAGRNTGVVAGWEATDIVPKDVVDMVIAARIYQGLNSNVVFLPGQFLPSDETRLECLDHLVLADDRLVNDLAALTAVRRWVHSGGRVWIMLDRTGPELLERLFGDEFQGAVIDQVGLTSVRIDTPPSYVLPEGKTGSVVEHDEPVAMTRMSPSPNMLVKATVNGWPAVMTRSYGEGRVMITTLGARGWLRPSPPFTGKEKNRPAPDMTSEFALLPQMEDIIPFVMARREAQPLPPETLEPFAQEFISYSVPTGTLIIGSMFGFLILLTATGSLLWRWGRLEHFGWCGSLLALLFAGLFFGIGFSNRHGTSATVASVQLAQAIPGTDDFHTHGATAVYHPEGGDAEIQTSEGGVLMPNLTGTEGATSRMVTTDLGTFHWAGLDQPAGLNLYQVVRSGANSDRLLARATLDSNGLVGQCTAQIPPGSDAMVVTRRGRLGVDVGSEGKFTAGANAVLERGQFLSATLVNDVRDRRRRILAQLFSDSQWQNSLDQPHMLLWVNGWEPGVNFGEGYQNQGDTLLVTPLKFSKPAAGSDVVIPSPLLDYVNRQPPDGSEAAGFWDDGRQEWQERTGESTTWLTVEVPREFLPFRAKKAQLQINVSGLMGQIEILGVKDNNVVSLETVTNPVGTLTINIDDPAALIVSETGELPLGIKAGLPEDPGAANTTDAPANSWKVHTLSLQLWGSIPETTEED